WPPVASNLLNPPPQAAVPLALDRKKLARWLEEARSLYNKAIACAPDDPRPYARRAIYSLHRISHEERMADIPIRSLDCEYPVPADRVILADFYTAASKGPPNAFTIAGPFFVELTAGSGMVADRNYDFNEARNLFAASLKQGRGNAQRTLAKLEA